MGKFVVRALLAVLAIAALVVAGGVIANWNLLQRTVFGGLKVYETTPPSLPADISRPAILVFSKTNGFRHEEAIPAANSMFEQAAKENGWGYFQTENGATFSPEFLARFDAIVFNNVSGDVFTPAQREAFKTFLMNGGGWVGVHGAGGDGAYDWRWYVEELIGAQFIGHPMDPQFQPATVQVEDQTSPATKHLPGEWTRTDEWYSFDRSVRNNPEFRVLAALSEASYANKKMFGKDIAMGADHPIAWERCIGKGRALYSAMGHQPQAYSEPLYRQMLIGAVRWTLRLEGDGCDGAVPIEGSGQK